MKRSHMIACVTALCLVPLALGCATSKGQPPVCPPVPEARVASPGGTVPDASELAQGKALFQEHCSDCHATDPGERIFLFRGVPSLECPSYGKRVSPDYLYEVIAEGGKAVGESRLMPGFADRLSETEIQSLVAFLRAPAEAP